MSKIGLAGRIAIRDAQHVGQRLARAVEGQLAEFQERDFAFAAHDGGHRPGFDRQRDPRGVPRHPAARRKPVPVVFAEATRWQLECGLCAAALRDAEAALGVVLSRLRLGRGTPCNGVEG